MVYIWSSKIEDSLDLVKGYNIVLSATKCKSVNFKITLQDEFETKHSHEY